LDLVGEHAFLGASKYHWVNYDDDKIVASFDRFLATQRGTELHDFAKRCIELGQRLPKSKLSLNSFVNDAIGYRMKPEQPLFYSINAFGTTDAICFRDELLRIHDLKTGVSSVSMTQLEIYAALFCLEYKVKPEEIKMELRIYQSNEIVVHKPTGEDIRRIMDKIISFDKKLELRKLEMED
jgi:hypothetical protein